MYKKGVTADTLEWNQMDDNLHSLDTICSQNLTGTFTEKSFALSETANSFIQKYYPKTMESQEEDYQSQSSPFHSLL